MIAKVARATRAVVTRSFIHSRSFIRLRSFIRESSSKELLQSQADSFWKLTGRATDLWLPMGGLLGCVALDYVFSVGGRDLASSAKELRGWLSLSSQGAVVIGLTAMDLSVLRSVWLKHPEVAWHPVRLPPTPIRVPLWALYSLLRVSFTAVLIMAGSFYINQWVIETPGSVSGLVIAKLIGGTASESDVAVPYEHERRQQVEHIEVATVVLETIDIHPGDIHPRP